MIAPLDDPGLRARVHLLDVEAYHCLGEVGLLGERTELIRGVVIDQMSKSSLHTIVLLVLLRHLMRQLPDEWQVRPEQPLTLGDSEPEPDIAIVLESLRKSRAGHPGTAQLIIEICVTSEALDRLKLELYAEAGVPEYWLILTASQQIERHTGIKGSAYTCVERINWSETLESTVIPGLFLPPVGFAEAVAE